MSILFLEVFIKIAIIGSRNIMTDRIGEYVTAEDEIVSGGADGVDQCAAEYAQKNNLKLTEFLPQYALYGRVAPIIRNKKIVDYCDRVVAFWDGNSKGTLSVIRYAEKVGKPCTVVLSKSI
jgi:predicted Rossmann fold nucleotide-binding protein DprA/Smf involved in DNA uptake